MKRAPRSRQRHDLYAKYHDYDSEISDLLGECGLETEQRERQEAINLAARAEAEAAADAAKAAKEAENRRLGQHCLSGWDGSNHALVEWTKKQMNDPNSFEHVQTRISTANEQREHTIVMLYRGANLFGGVVRNNVMAQIRTSDCSVASVSFNG